jgi:hypothetical protein
MNNLFSLPKKIVCGYQNAEDKEQFWREFDRSMDEFMLKSGTKKDKKKINFGDIARGICWEDVEDFDSLTRYMLMDVEMKIMTDVNVSLACGSSYDNVAEIYERKKSLHINCIYTKKVSVDLYWKIMRSLPIGYGGTQEMFKDLLDGILHTYGVKVRLEIDHNI